MGWILTGIVLAFFIVGTHLGAPSVPWTNAAWWPMVSSLVVLCGIIMTLWGARRGAHRRACALAILIGGVGLGLGDPVLGITATIALLATTQISAFASATSAVVGAMLMILALGFVGWSMAMLCFVAIALFAVYFVCRGVRVWMLLGP